MDKESQSRICDTNRGGWKVKNLDAYVNGEWRRQTAVDGGEDGGDDTMTTVSNYDTALWAFSLSGLLLKWDNK